MSIETEGAINRMTAAVLALTTTVDRAVSGHDEAEAQEAVNDRYEDHLETILGR